MTDSDWEPESIGEWPCTVVVSSMKSSEIGNGSERLGMTYEVIPYGNIWKANTAMSYRGMEGVGPTYKGVYMTWVKRGTADRAQLTFAPPDLVCANLERNLKASVERPDVEDSLEKLSKRGVGFGF